ncbi:MAG: C25 family cysteine peptidase, partial [Thermoplasmatota archaeon]
MLQYVPDLAITITTTPYQDGTDSLYRGLPADEDYIKDMICNPDMIQQYNTPKSPSEPVLPLGKEAPYAQERREPVHYVYDKESGTITMHQGDTVSTFAAPSTESTTGLSPTTSYDYVIITTDALASYTGANSFHDLVNSKTAKGLSATIVTVEDITSNSSFWNANPVFNDTQAQIREFIRYAYLNWGTEYVLLGGDSDDGSPVVPARMLYHSIDNTYMPSDIYYACLDGTYNYDEDGQWGEPTDGDGGGDVDLMAEVYVGRAPVDSTAEVQHFVMKTLAYENTNSPYLKDVFMVGEQLDSNPTWGGDYKDEIINGSCANGYCTVGVPGGEYNISTLYDRDYSWSKTELMQYMNDGTHIFNHLGHANCGYGMRMSNSDVSTLSNTDYFFAYSQGCISGSFDNIAWDGSSWYNYGDECIAEYFTVESEHGAFAVIMNARFGWYNPGGTDGTSQHFDREFFDAVYNESMPEIGKANQDSKHDNLWRVGGYDTARWCYYTINLLGDPEVALKNASIPEKDVGVDSINHPTGYNCLGDYTVNATLKNYGNTTQTFNVTCRIYNTTTWTEVYNITNSNITLQSLN